jgi:hypothetical protein
MDAKKDRGRTPQLNIAKDGTEEGTVWLVGEGSGPHEWRISTDEKTWINLPSTRGAKTLVTDLISGQVYYFQNRLIVSGTEKDEWRQSVKFRVK